MTDSINSAESSGEEEGAASQTVLALIAAGGFFALLAYAFMSNTWSGSLLALLMGLVGLGVTAWCMHRETGSTLPYGPPLIGCLILIAVGLVTTGIHAVQTWFPHLGETPVTTVVHENGAAIAGKVAPELAGCRYVDRTPGVCERAAKIRIATEALQVAPAIADRYRLDAGALTRDLVTNAMAALHIKD